MSRSALWPVSNVRLINLPVRAVDAQWMRLSPSVGA